MNKNSDTENDPAILATIRERMSAVINRNLTHCSSLDTCIPGLSIHRITQAVKPASYLFEPSFSLIVRGAKRVVLGDKTYAYDQSQFLLTAINLPTVVEVLEASEERPYLSIMQKIDLDLARQIITEVDIRRGETQENGIALALGPVTVSLATATMTLVDLVEKPEDAAILARSVQREILFRILTSPVGGQLRQAVDIGAQTKGVSRAIQWIRDNFSDTLRIDKLAKLSGMGESTMHHHFRTVTSMSPLQYQKHMRLHEARRLMINDKMGASVAAHRVGYESATQFTREYRRLFGTPPKRDVRSILSSSEIEHQI